MSHNPKYISYSRLDSFNRCERCHAFSAFTPFKSSPALEKGSHAHAGWEALGKEMLTGATADEALARVLENPPAGYLSDAGFSSYMVRAMAVLREAQVREVEQWIPRTTNYARLVGKIDLVLDNTPVASRGVINEWVDEPCVVDYKTTSSYAYIKNEDEARKSIQPMIYHLAQGVQNFAYFWFLPSGPPVVTTIRFTEEETVYADAWLHNAIDSVEKRWQNAWDAGIGRDEPDNRLLVEGYDLSLFAVGPPDRPFIDSKFSSHRELCLGLKGDA